MKRKILVPHDGHTMSDHALATALEIARGMNMDIILVRVIPEVTGLITNIVLLGDEETDRVKKAFAKLSADTQGQMVKRVKKLVSYCGSRKVKATMAVPIGDPAEEILALAKKEKPYLIVMGRRRLKGFSRLKSIGSVSRRVSEESKSPVLIVR